MVLPRRSIQQGSLEDFPLPVSSEDIAENTYIALVTAVKGQSLFEISLPVSINSDADSRVQTDGPPSSGVLVQLPNRFKNTLWVKRGNFCT